MTRGPSLRHESLLHPSPEPFHGESDIERAFIEACDEIGCAYDNEALLSAIAGFKKEMRLQANALSNCHIEIKRLRTELLNHATESKQ